MELRTLILGFLAWAVYPAWLAAGAADYFCHRRTDIEHTSGSVESWLHVAQFACIGAMLTLALLPDITRRIWIVMLCAALAHSAIAFIDVSYTEKRRRISPLEQFAHGYLDVLPLMAVGLVALLSWSHWQASAGFALRDQMSPEARTFVLVSFCVFAGAPVFEELARSLRTRAPRRNLKGATP